MNRAVACIDDETLARYAEGSLELDAIAVVDQHVDGCHTCRRVLAETVAAGEGMAAFEPGTPAFTGRYRVLRLIGRGGMGVVFEAADQRLGIPVALKTLRDLDGPMLLRLKNEFRALADLRHRNLVRLGELVQEDQSWFFTMELVRGSDFLGHVRPTPAGADEGRLREALAQLAEGVSALHRAQKVHRDLKPSNILVEHGGRVVVLDFGLVVDSDRRPALDPHAGTPEYMAPEQRTGGPVGPAADWYAVGVILYEALTGRRPAPPDREALKDAPADLAELCLDLLSPDPAERPREDEVRARLGQASPRPPLPPAPPFVGRLDERDRLREALRAAGETLRVIVVEGESGVGKTALVRSFVEEASAGGACVLGGRCHERESVPYKALDGIVDALSRHLSGLPADRREALVPDDVGLIADAFPVLLGVEAALDPHHARPRPRDPAERRRGMARALRALLDRLAGASTLVLTIDDLQWSDPDSIALLADLLRPPEAPPLLLVGTLRSGTPLDLPCAVERISLGPLPPAEARELARHCLVAGAGEARAVAVAEETGGHPLFIAELAHHSVAAGPGPATLDGALGARVAALPEQPRAVLELLAVAAGPVGEEALARASGQPLHVHEQSVALLRAERLVRSGGQAVETYHDRVRAAVSGRLDGAGRRLCHERLAVGLEAAADGDPEVLAVHWHAAGHDQRAAQHAVRAADRAAAALAFERAARLYRMAIELDPARSDLTELRTSLANVLVNDGRQGEAGEAFLAAARGATGSAAVDLKRRAAQHLLASHHVDRGLPILDEVLGAVGLRRARSNRRVVLRMIGLRLRLALRGLRFRAREEAQVPPALLQRIDVCGSSWIGLGLSNQLLPAAEFHTRFLAGALQAGEPRRLALGFAAEVFFACLLGPERLRRAIRLMPIAEKLAAEGADPLPRARLESVRGVTAWVGGRWGESEEILARAQELIRQQCVGANLERQLVLYTLLCTRVYTGKIDLMRGVIRQEMREAEAREDRWVALLYGASGYAAFVRLADGDVEEARRHVDRAARSALPPWAISTSRMAIAFYSDDRAGLRDELEGLRRQWPSLERTQLLRHPIDGVRLCDLRGRAAATLALGAPPEEKPALLREARQVAGWLDRRPAAWAAPHAELLRAIVGAAEGDQAGCARGLEKAARGFSDAGLPMHAAALRRRLGEAPGWFDEERIRDPEAFTRVFVPPLTST
jgi:serine/threonine protein kinase